MPFAPPSVDEFLNFIRDEMRVDKDVLTDDSVYIQRSFDIAMEWVNTDLSIAGANIYAAAVYNFAASTLIRIAQDLQVFDSTDFAGQTPGNDALSPGFDTKGGFGYWSGIRKSFGVNSLTSGLVSSTSDEGTSTTLMVADFVKGMSAMDLQMIKDPYGQEYFRIAQQYGEIWGMS